MKKGTYIKIFSILFVLLLLLGSFLGCGYIKNKQAEKVNVPENNSPVPETVCLLIGNTRNVLYPDKKVMKSELAQMAEQSANCFVITVDGKPDTCSRTFTAQYPESLAMFQDANNQKYIDKTANEIMLSCVPNEAEIDILGALRSAEKEFSKDKNTKKRIVIFGSGISTAGALNFAANPKLIETDPNDIVTMLKTSKSLPDLTDVEIVWHGFSIVEAPQKQLSDLNEYRLKCIWETILIACNATVCSLESEIGTEHNGSANINKEKYPQVSVVEFPNIIEIDETKVQFKPGTAEFLDEVKAYEELKPYAEMIKQSGCTNFYVIGSTASFSTKEKCLTLSSERADAVKNVLCSFGVPESFLEVYGIGRENFGGEYKWRVNDLQADGKTLAEPLATQNRKVIIIDKNSEKGLEFKRIWDQTMA